MRTSVSLEEIMKNYIAELAKASGTEHSEDVPRAVNSITDLTWNDWVQSYAVAVYTAQRHNDVQVLTQFLDALESSNYLVELTPQDPRHWLIIEVTKKILQMKYESQ